MRKASVAATAALLLSSSLVLAQAPGGKTGEGGAGASPGASGEGPGSSARDVAPGQMKEPGTSARDVAPGQVKPEGQSAREFAPGQNRTGDDGAGRADREDRRGGAEDRGERRGDAAERNERDDRRGEAADRGERRDDGASKERRAQDRDAKERQRDSAEDKKDRAGAGTGAAEGTAGRDSQKGDGEKGSVADLSPEVKTRVRSAFSRHRVDPVRDLDISISVGVAVPRSVRLYPVPEDVVVIVPAYREYRYFRIGDRICIVDPDTYEIVDVIILV